MFTETSCELRCSKVLNGCSTAARWLLDSCSMVVWQTCLMVARQVLVGISGVAVKNDSIGLFFKWPLYQQSLSKKCYALNRQLMRVTKNLGFFLISCMLKLYFSYSNLFQVNAMLNFLEACHYKVSCAVCQCEGRMQPHSKFQQYIEKTKDKSVSGNLIW